MHGKATADQKTADQKTADQKISVVYDGQCPVCHRYCEMAKSNAEAYAADAADLTGATGATDAPVLELLDAREDSELMQRISQLGMDIDEGMVVVIGDELHYGADAIHALANVETKRGVFGVVSRLMFARRRSARFLYPWLRRIRNLLLKLLRKQRINNLKLPGRDRF